MVEIVDRALWLKGTFVFIGPHGVAVHHDYSDEYTVFARAVCMPGGRSSGWVEPAT